MFLSGLLPSPARPADDRPSGTRTVGPTLRELYPASTWNERADLVDERFGMLVVESFLRPGGHEVGAIWLCRCDCGGTREVSTRRLNEHVEDCGCRSGRSVNLTGETFGLLTACAIFRAAPRGFSWLCECVCGLERVATSSELTSGEVQCCGMPACKLAVRRLAR